MTPRLLNHGAAATYCGMSKPHFDAHIAPHVPPIKFGPRKQWWDRVALDAHLDRLSGISNDMPCPVEWLDRA